MSERMNKNGGEAKLRRVISGPLLVLYGLGTMLGAGIFALIGEVAGAAGFYAPAAFGLASIIAGLTAASFAELSSRLPKSAGPAAYVLEGFRSRRLSLIAGLLIIAAGVISSGVLFRGFVGYAGDFVEFPDWTGFLALSIAVGAIAVWGVAESLTAVAAITILEAGALVLIIALGFNQPAVPVLELDTHGPAPVAGIISGAVLAFYAFIGFEDMVNIAEEVKNPTRVMPRSIIAALTVTTLIYIFVSWTAVRTTPISMLLESDSPMTLIYSRLTDFPSETMSVIAMVAIINGALAQTIMASRMLYGMSEQKTLPAWFGEVSTRTRTPVNATLFVVALIFLAALALPLATLAQATSFLLLCLFALVNAALIAIKRETPAASAFKVPIIIPYLGFFAAALFALVSLKEIIL
ncbi:MAG: amino acid permease [Marinicaulis sp.]|nr:amino acid permease [Marinicaulis sp.]